MSSTTKKILIGIGSLVLLLLLAVGGFGLYLTTESGQKWLLDTVLRELSSTLQTKVEAKKATANIFTGEFTLYGTEIDDRSGVKMLSVDTLEIGLSPLELLERHIVISHIELAGADVVLYKENRDTAANYQFIIDELRHDDSKAKDEKDKEGAFKFCMDVSSVELRRINASWDIKSEPQKGDSVLDMNHIKLVDFHALMEGEITDDANKDFIGTDIKVRERNSGMALCIGRMAFLNTCNDAHRAEKATPDSTHAGKLEVQMQGITFAYLDKHVACDMLSLQQEAAHLTPSLPLSLKVDSLSFKNDNGKPRRNAGKPKRGAFDAGHIDATLNLQATICVPGNDSIHAVIDHLDAYDKGSELWLKDVSGTAGIRKDMAVISDMKIAMDNTRISLGTVRMHFGNALGGKEAGNGVPSQSNGTQKLSNGKATQGNNSTTALRIEEFPLTATVQLQDIAQPFAPVLSNFTTPLTLSVTCGGTLDKFVFRNIIIGTKDKRLHLTAEGELLNVTKKELLTLHFRNIHLSASNGIKEQIVNHFSKKTNLKMQKQMAKVGDITFDGKLDVLHKRENVAGTLHSKYGNVKFDFSIDGNTKMMDGTMSTDSINIGAIMNIKGLRLGPCRAKYSINVANKNSSPNYGIKGHLPIGKLVADIEGARYRIAKFKRISADIVSDGTTAHGSVDIIHSIVDVDLTFEYKQSSAGQSLQVHHKTKLHNKLNNKLFKIKLKKDTPKPSK